jgi:hypothetical protein
VPALKHFYDVLRSARDDPVQFGVIDVSLYLDTAMFISRMQMLLSAQAHEAYVLQGTHVVVPLSIPWPSGRGRCPVIGIGGSMWKQFPLPPCTLRGAAVPCTEWLGCPHFWCPTLFATRRCVALPCIPWPMPYCRWCLMAITQGIIPL